MDDEDYGKKLSEFFQVHDKSFIEDFGWSDISDDFSAEEGDGD